MEPDKSHHEMKRMLARNAELLEENNKLLRKIHRNGLIEFWVRVLWYILLIGLPFAIYFYLLEPYFSALGANYEVFRAGISEVPGFTGLNQLLQEMGW
jgi:hypothetical protein